MKKNIEIGGNKNPSIFVMPTSMQIREGAIVDILKGNDGGHFITINGILLFEHANELAKKSKDIGSYGKVTKRRK